MSRKVVLVYVNEDGVGKAIEHILDGTLRGHNVSVTVGSSLHGYHIPMMNSAGEVLAEPVNNQDRKE